MSLKTSHAKAFSILMGVALVIFAFTSFLGSGGVSDAGVSEDTGPLDAAHILPPTDEMMDIARSQCDDGRSQGIVELVSPGTDEVVSRAVVDCS